MKTTTYSVLNMSCGSCKAKIEKAVNQLEGISEVTVSVAKKQLVVTYDESKTTNETIINTVAETGYTSEKI